MSNATSTMLSVIHGEPLARAIAGLIADFRQRDQLSRITVIAPSIYSSSSLRRVLPSILSEDRSGDRIGMFNVELMRIDDVADRLCQAAPNRAGYKPEMSRIIAAELIFRAMSELRTPGPLTRHTESQSTIAAVQRTIRSLELLECGAEEALSRLGAGRQRPIYMQLLEIERKYRIKARRYITREQVASLASDIVRNDQFAVASVLGKMQIMIALPTARDAFSSLRDAIADLPSNKIIMPEDDHDTPDAQPFKTLFYTTSTTPDESRMLLRNILADARSGIKFGDMAVFVPYGYERRVLDAMQLAEIPARGRSPTTLAETPRGRFVISLLMMLAKEMRRQDFAAWITACPVIEPSSGIRVPSARWDQIMRDAKARRIATDSNCIRLLTKYRNSMSHLVNRAQTNPDLDHAASAQFYADQADLTNRLINFIHDLNDQLQNVEKEIGSWTSRVEWLEQMLARYYPSEVNDDRENSDRDRVATAIDELRKLDESISDGVTLQRFSSVVSHAMRMNSRKTVLPPEAVLVTTLNSALGCVFKSIHILSMSEENYPGSVPSDPLLPDYRRQEIDPAGETLPSKEQLQQQRRRDYRYALSSASLRHLYWNQTGISDTEIKHPSPWYMEELRKDNAELPVSIEDVISSDSGPIHCAPTVFESASYDIEPGEKYEFDMRSTAQANADPELKRRFLELPWNDGLNRALKFADSRSSPIFTEFDGNIRPLSMDAVNGKEQSASRLQNYAICPFRFYLKEVLMVEQVEDEDDNLMLSALDKGLLVHDILEDIVSWRSDDSSGEAPKDLLRRVAMGRFDQFADEHPIGHQKLFQIETQKLVEQLENWLASESNLLDAFGIASNFAEESFGAKSESPVSLTLPDDTEIFLRGQIDRIALSEDGRMGLVIDYKTGRSRNYTDVEKDPLAAGAKLQLGMYMLAARSMYPEVENISAAYWFVLEEGNKRFRPDGFAAETVTVKRLIEVMQVIAFGISNGIFPARPSKNHLKDKCGYCPYDRLCPSNRIELWNNKTKSRELRAYVKMTDPGRA